MAKKKFDLNCVTYLNIRDLTFLYTTPDEMNIPDKEGHPTQFSLDIVKMFSQEEEIVRLVFTLHLQTLLNDAREIKGLYSTEHLFHVQGLAGWVTKVEVNFQVNEDLDDMLSGLVYSTARGLVRQKFSSTWFADFMLPIAKTKD